MVLALNDKGHRNKILDQFEKNLYKQSISQFNVDQIEKIFNKRKLQTQIDDKRRKKPNEEKILTKIIFYTKTFETTMRWYASRQQINRNIPNIQDNVHNNNL